MCMSSFAFQRKFSLKNFTIHFYLEHNSLNYKVFPIFSIIGLAYFLIFFFPLFLELLASANVNVCLCMPAHVYICLWGGRIDFSLTPLGFWLGD